VGVTYYKRYRMEINLRGRMGGVRLPRGYRLVAWNDSLCGAHAVIKCECFRGELDAGIFPCLGEYDGCSDLMEEIASGSSFIPEATWLVEYLGEDDDRREKCGTIQGLRVNSRYGAIQNLGITPSHRGRGLATGLLDAALIGFQQGGLRRVALEVTAQNTTAVRLYRQYGFRRTKTLYKSVETPELVWA